MSRRHRFTLIELLVVVSIISILASMLLPSLSRARYQARMTSCMNTTKQVALAVQLYTSDNADRYPYRSGSTHWGLGAPNVLYGYASPTFDDRPMMKDYFSDDMYCPFLPKKRLFESTSRLVRLNYNIWAGYPISDTAKTMVMVGDVAEFDGAKFNIIVSEMDLMYNSALAESSHPGTRNSPVLNSYSDTGAEFATYTVSGTHERGYIDQNYARDDGSVFRINRIAPVDSRMTKVNYKYSNAYQPLTSRWGQLPTADY